MNRSVPSKFHPTIAVCIALGVLTLCFQHSLANSVGGGKQYTDYDVHETIWSRKLPQLKLILAKQPELARFVRERGKGEGPDTSLCIAASQGWIEGGELLLKYGAPVDAGNPPPLVNAAGRGNDAFVRLLLAHKANINATGSDKQTALHEAIRFGHRETAKLLLQQGAKSDIFVDAGLGRTDVVAAALKSDATLATKRGARQETLLHWAAASNVPAMAELLLARQANINARDSESQTPLDVAITVRANEMVAYLLGKGADFKTTGVSAKGADFADGHSGTWRSVETSLETAVRANNIPAAKLLLARGAKVNHKGIDGATPLALTAILGSVEMAKLLIDSGAAINSMDDEHTPRINDSLAPSVTLWTPLHWAAYEGRLDMVKILVEHKANINARSSKTSGEQTPLAVARGLKHTLVVNYLVQHGGK
jgi:ankyrin repeat protein